MVLSAKLKIGAVEPSTEIFANFADYDISLGCFLENRNSRLLNGQEDFSCLRWRDYDTKQ